MGILCSIFHTNSYVMLGLFVGLATEPLTGLIEEGGQVKYMAVSGCGARAITIRWLLTET